MYDVAAILEIISSISSSLALDEILAEFTEKTAHIIGADGCAIFRWDRDGNTITILAGYLSPQLSRRPEAIRRTGMAYPLAHYPATTRVLREQVPLIIYAGDRLADQATLDLLTVSGWTGLLLVPMLYKGQAVGLLELATRRKKGARFAPEDILLCQALANQAAVAIQNAQLFAERETQREALHQLSLRLIHAQEEERRRISGEIHDELGQALTAIKINLDVVRRLLPGDLSPQLYNSVQEAGLLVAQTLERARSLSLELHPAILDDLGLLSALQWEIDRYERRTGQAVHFEANLTDILLPPELKITTYRIIIEALTNVARHAQASRVSINLFQENGCLIIKVEDNGVGFDPAPLFIPQAERRSLGLISMRERTELLGGQFHVLSKPGRGAKIYVRLPL